MRNSLIFVAALFVFCIGTIYGQSVTDIKAKYKKYSDSSNAFSVSKRIWMTPEYAVDEEVCRMKFFPSGTYSKPFLSRSL